MHNWTSISINVNFYQKQVYLTFTSRNLIFIFSANKNKILKLLYNMSLRKLRSLHGNVSVMARAFEIDLVDHSSN